MVTAGLGGGLIHGDPLVQDETSEDEDEATCELSPQPALRFQEVTTSERGGSQAGRSPLSPVEFVVMLV